MPTGDRKTFDHYRKQLRRRAEAIQRRLDEVTRATREELVSIKDQIHALDSVRETMEDDDERRVNIVDRKSVSLTKNFKTVLEPLVRYRRHQANATTSATRSLRRFEEELHVLQQAHAHATAHDLLRGESAPGRSLRNNLVNEAYEDLRAGDRAAFRAKIGFVMRRVPRLRRDPYVLALRVLGHFGPVGVSALGLGRSVAVRLGLG